MSPLPTFGGVGGTPGGIIIPNPAGIALIGFEPTVGIQLGIKAARIAGVAKSIAPVDTGAFRDSIDSDVVRGEAGFEGRVTTDSPYWFYLEYGTSDTPTFATLRRALEASPE